LQMKKLRELGFNPKKKKRSGKEGGKESTKNHQLQDSGLSGKIKVKKRGGNLPQPDDALFGVSEGGDQKRGSLGEGKRPSQRQLETSP